MADFEPAVALVLKHEGVEEAVNYDRGLATKYGISLIFYRRNIKADAIDADIHELTLDAARNIYKEYFWNKYRFAEIIDQHLVNRLFDLAVNCGPKQAFILMQRACNQRQDIQLIVDGKLGDMTLMAINNPAIISKLYTALIDEATTYYKRIANIAHNNQFLEGWLHRLNDTP